MESEEMRMKRKIVALMLSLTVVMGLSTSVFANSSDARNKLNEALRERTFYKYNVAYNEIVKLEDAALRDQMLGELGAIADVVWTSDVKKFNSMLDNLVNTKGSGKIYDDIEAQVGGSSLAEEDKQYLLGELTSWGKRIVYTSDYSDAVEKVVYAWKMLSSGSEVNLNNAITAAEKAINSVKNSYSKVYLSDQLKQIKEKGEFTVVDIS
jgi:hypothetical protein